MYIIELLIKKLFKNKEAFSDEELSEENAKLRNADYETCEHVFMPIDSTREILSCTKCGIIKKRSELKNINFFIKD